MKILLGVGVFILMFLILAALLSLPVMLLWDWLMPSIFGLREITWVEALGLNFLSALLIKSNNIIIQSNQ